MRTFTFIKDMPVFEKESGTIVGHVCDISISASGKVTGLLVKKNKLFHPLFFLDINDLHCSEDGILIKNINSLKKPLEPPVNTFLHQNSLTGKWIKNQKGETVGLLKDVYFLEEMGTIVGYEYTDGFFSDLSEGTRILQSVIPPAIGKDAIIVDANPM